jgi:hypothetical protein
MSAAKQTAELPGMIIGGDPASGRVKCVSVGTGDVFVAAYDLEDGIWYSDPEARIALTYEEFYRAWIQVDMAMEASRKGQR